MLAVEGERFVVGLWGRSLGCRRRLEGRWWLDAWFFDCGPGSRRVCGKGWGWWVLVWLCLVLWMREEGGEAALVSAGVCGCGVGWVYAVGWLPGGTCWGW